MAEALPVYIVDDDDAVRESTALLLEARSLTVQTFASAQDFLDVAASLAAGCVVSDLRMPKMSGLDLLRRLQELKLPHSVVVMTAHGEVSLAVQALKGGAIDFIEKPFTAETLIDAVEAALRSVEQAQQKGADASAFNEHVASLTPREREVMGQLVAGHPNKVIAFNLGMSPRTVEVHRARVMEKMHARSISALVKMAVAAGFE
jgi:two-component system response regulator FixJ